MSICTLPTMAISFIADACWQLWYKKPAAGITRIIDLILKVSDAALSCYVDIGGSMGTVPRQESVSNISMHHRELLKWHC